MSDMDTMVVDHLNAAIAQQEILVKGLRAIVYVSANAALTGADAEFRKQQQVLSAMIEARAKIHRKNLGD